MIIVMGSNGVGWILACRERYIEQFYQKTTLLALFATSSSFKILHAQICNRVRSAPRALQRTLLIQIIVLSTLRCV